MLRLRCTSNQTLLCFRALSNAIWYWAYINMWLQNERKHFFLYTWEDILNLNLNLKQDRGWHTKWSQDRLYWYRPGIFRHGPGAAGCVIFPTKASSLSFWIKPVQCALQNTRTTPEWPQWFGEFLVHGQCPLDTICETRVFYVKWGGGGKKMSSNSVVSPL